MAKKELDPIKKKQIIKEKLKERKKSSKQTLKKKRARLVVKNLPFKATEENVKEYFKNFGEIENVQLLRKPDGKLVGCGFVQFKLVQKAAKARHHTNGSEFLGRNIIVEFAQSKDKYKKEVKHKIESVEIKSEEKVGDVRNENTVKLASSSDEDDKALKNFDSDDETDEEDHNVCTEHVEPEVKKPQVISNDVTEGKTVFIKNVPFDATKDDLRECMSQFGPMYYALICIDKLTEHSKGTAFVKFKNKEDAEKALTAGTELKLMGNILDCHPAIGRDEIQRKAMIEKKSMKKPKDTRNLYLVKEGVILAGSKAADGVSAADMDKRLQLEQYKSQILRNLNMFVSRERLVVHNLPTTWDDRKLRILFEKHGRSEAVIKEARVMRNMRQLDSNGIGVSKEYGFVTFTKHEDALHALRSLNNNPNIFSPNKRPIVSFSIENKSMIKAKQHRLEKSRQNILQKNAEKNEKKAGKKKSRNKKKSLVETKPNTDIDTEYTGVTTKPGVVEKMRSRYKLTMQAKMHHDNLKKAKKKKNETRKTLDEKKKDFIKQPKQKINKTKNSERDGFSKLVNEYKQKLLNVPTPKKRKWFE